MVCSLCNNESQLGGFITADGINGVQGECVA